MTDIDEHIDLTRRPRRLRTSESMRSMVREHRVHRDDLVMPVFVTAEDGVRREIPSMPGIYQYSIDELDRELDALLDAGVSRIILFGIPEDKDAIGSDTWASDGIIQRALRHIEDGYGDSFLKITDVCFCEYTDHGHCGVVDDQGQLLNDPTLANLQKQVVSHAEAGADMVAPSGMIDGMIGAIRTALDEEGFHELPVMSYAVKYASAFYGPFRDAADTASDFGHRKRYQMDPANAREARIEARLDVEQGADFLMVKPALPYLDMIRRIDESFDVPLACYNVSGEYAMIKAAAREGWLEEMEVAHEKLLSMKRAGADVIISYFSRELASHLSD
jgi:porphobilinogen synthase